jgi:hypothetical protein
MSAPAGGQCIFLAQSRTDISRIKAPAFEVHRSASLQAGSGSNDPGIAVLVLGTAPVFAMGHGSGDALRLSASS